ncbi:MAG TPA: M48 family metalloprotease [Pirellulaceae bacterium]|nr:M48 family metalloprotease [Pirellulaceae bacterium]
MPPTSPADESAATNSRRLVPRNSQSLLITTYSACLLFTILAYFAVLIIAIFELLNLGGALTSGLSHPNGYPILTALAALWVLFLLTRLATHFWRCMLGLVTQRYDHLPDSALGTLLPASVYPSLYAAVAEVGTLIHSPTPDEIRLTHQPDCYAVELRAFAISTDRKLVLVIGMPQLEVLTQSELKVIIAHELAHFGGGDTRLSVFVFRFLESLRQAQQEMDGLWGRWIDPVSWLSWAYFHWFFLLSAPIRKRQELRADAQSAEAFGGEFAARTLMKDWLLERKFKEAIGRYQQAKEQRPEFAAANLFRDFAAHFHELTPEGREYLERRLTEEERASFWDSHPTLRERMTSMRQYPARPEPEPLPARLLLPDFELLEFEMQQVWQRESSRRLLDHVHRILDAPSGRN